jgi:cell division protein FtsB
MKVLILALAILTLLLQYKLWFADGGIGDVKQLEKKINVQTAENNQLAEHNRLLAAEVDNLKQGNEAIEERARTELGMIKDDEVFYQIVE